MFAIRPLSALLALGVFGASAAVAEPMIIGAVDRVQAHVDATQAGQTRALSVSSGVYFRDRCHSGEGARLQATLKDGTQLTLGENATLVVDEFVYDPSALRGELSLRIVKGAFLYVGGMVEGLSGAKVRIQTPVAAIGVRGTTVWGGPIDNGYGVIVLSGEATVTGRRGTVILKKGQGTMLFGDGRPQRAAGWPAGRMKRAIASITFAKLSSDLKPRKIGRARRARQRPRFGQRFACHRAWRDEITTRPSARVFHKWADSCPSLIGDYRSALPR